MSQRTIGVCVGTGVVPPGLPHIFPLHRALPCRASTNRRYAAGFALAADVGRGSKNLFHGARSNRLSPHIIAMDAAYQGDGAGLRPADGRRRPSPQKTPETRSTRSAPIRLSCKAVPEEACRDSSKSSYSLLSASLLPRSPKCRLLGPRFVSLSSAWFMATFMDSSVNTSTALRSKLSALWSPTRNFALPLLPDTVSKRRKCSPTSTR